MSALQVGRSTATSGLLYWWRSRLGRRFLLELGLIVGLVAGYRYVRYLAKDAGEPAIDNARRILEFERSIGADIEGGIQDLALQSQGFMEFINNYYVTSHFAVTVSVMFWIYLRRPFVYARLRWVLIAITVAALVIHVAFPLAPPRMMSGTGLIDTLKAYGPSIYGSPESGSANQFAAMPSLHFGYAALAAWGVLLSFRTRWRHLAVVHPLLMLFAIMATANHYWVDAAVAGLLLVVSGLVVWWLVNVPEEQAEALARTRPADDPGPDSELELVVSDEAERPLVDA